VKQLCNVGYYLTKPNSSQYLSPSDVVTRYVLKKNIYPGAQLNNVHLLTRSIVGNAFIPRTEADTISFSSKNLPQILQHFSMVPGSELARLMENSLNICEDPGLKGEKKFCSTSLESMVDNVISLLGTHDIQAISPTINGPQHEKNVYHISSPVKEFSNDKIVICHPLPSPQAMHYCHTNIAYKAYLVTLVGANGSTVHGVTVCHHDLINFNPSILNVLQVKPGIDLICHFLPGDHILWTRT
jgi:BURP domain